MRSQPFIELYPEFLPIYYSFYLRGLIDLFGKDSLHFSTQNFIHVKPHLGLRIDNKTVYVSADDFTFYNQVALERCDVYAKVNLSKADIPPNQVNKLIPIGPSFGVRCFGLAEGLIFAAHAIATSPASFKKPLQFIKGFVIQAVKRLPITAYVPEPSDPGYIFASGSLWHISNVTNEYRSYFFRAAQAQPGIRFEGGFVSRPNSPPGYDSLLGRKYTLAEYLERTKHSAVVFNTPALHGCHGWKLGEFLALGKAIISTPLSRELPAPLVHGEHIHFVEPTIEAISEAIRMIRNDDGYRHHLETNARSYYDTYLTPQTVIRRIMARLEA